MDSLTDEIEAVLFVAREVMGEYACLLCSHGNQRLRYTVYQIPPRTTTAGYKAAEWNVESFLWKGRMRVLDVGSRSEIRLEVCQAR